jgi:PIN domain nuclease of toxin-antitoxin system
MMRPERLNARARRLWAEGQAEIVISAASTWEIAIKSRVGKLDLPAPIATFVRASLEDEGLVSLPVEHAHAVRVAELPLHHADPFDRLLIAQAQVEHLPVMTADAQLAAYDVELIWAGPGDDPDAARAPVRRRGNR